MNYSELYEHACMYYKATGAIKINVIKIGEDKLQICFLWGLRFIFLKTLAPCTHFGRGNVYMKGRRFIRL